MSRAPVIKGGRAPAQTSHHPLCLSLTHHSPPDNHQKGGNAAARCHRGARAAVLTVALVDHVPVAALPLSLSLSLSLVIPLGPHTHPHVLFLHRIAARSSSSTPVSEETVPLAADEPAHPRTSYSARKLPRVSAVDPDPRRRRSPPAGSLPGRSPSPLLLPPSGGTGRLCAVDLRINGHSAFPPVSKFWKNDCPGQLLH